MTDMEKREKVLHGLNAHVNGHPHTRCHKCPYWGTGPHGSSECNVLAADALDLLKAQGPKKPIVSGKRYGNYLEHCPSCGIMLPNNSEYGKSFYCYKCGQAVKWK